LRLLTVCGICRIISNDYMCSSVVLEFEKSINTEFFPKADWFCRLFGDFFRLVIWMMYVRVWKRLFDVFFSSVALVFLSPIFLLLTIWIKLDSKGPIFFRQKRVGQNKEYFEILKFRTMRVDTPSDVPTHLLKNPKQWITRSGAFLRKTSLDELPQLINILTGDMSFVGPRPALWNQFDLIEARDRYGANDIPQGLTGWAQVNGRDELEIEEKARLDGEYTKKISFFMDLKCLMLTISNVLGHKGVVEGGTGELQRTKDQKGNEEQGKESIA